MLSNILKPIDYFLDRITMYRLVLYELTILILAAIFLGFFNFFQFSGLSIIYAVSFITAVSYITNKIFSYVFRAPTNIESVYITAFILTLIITPANSLNGFIFLGWAAVWAQASKYIFAINKKHIFNPVAISVVLTAAVIDQSASWWVGNAYLAPLVFILGLLTIRKIRREDLVFSFFITAAVTIFGFAILAGSDLFTTADRLLLHSSLLFFGFIMLTEPLTTPPTKTLQIIYGVIVGFLFAPQVHIGNIYSTPEIALVLGNVYSYLVSPKGKFLLTVKEKIKITPDVLDLVFSIDKQFNFNPGQYMEWTLPHKNPDSRGNRRYFTIASSPTEENLRLGIKFYPNGSTFKKAMAALDDKTLIMGGQLAGDFTLPSDPNKKLVFIAGGIGITPFRSMIKYLLDTNQKRDIVLLYSNKLASEIVYQDIFNRASRQLGIRTVYTLTDQPPANWPGKVGKIDSNMIKQEIPDFLDRTFYISGPQVMVTAFKDLLQNLGLPSSQIRTDFFPGLV